LFSLAVPKTGNCPNLRFFAPMQPTAKIILKKGKEASLQRYHRWVFSGAIEKIEGVVTPGILAEVLDFKGKYLAVGFYFPGSISVKILSFAPFQNLDQLLSSLVAEAYEVRKSSGLVDSRDTNCYRLVHGEADGLPGIIADFYDRHLVIQLHSRGLESHLAAIKQAFQSSVGVSEERIFVRSAERRATNSEPPPSDRLVVMEHGITSLVDLERGQKTGLFLDQRENRKLLKSFSSGRTVLNTYCYTGGFTLNALSGGANHVDSVDSSAWALEQLQENLQMNGWEGPNHCAYNSDAVEFLQQMETGYDLIVLDPPAFAKSISARHNAIQAYKRINLLALRKIKKHGILFTFSCSQVVGPELFAKTVYSAAIEAKRSVRILHRLGQPPDHPVNIFHPETEYLKGLVLSVE
jgi:23S rRNA (cytosine1962-C5)-methyltransferase